MTTTKSLRPPRRGLRPGPCGGLVRPHPHRQSAFARHGSLRRILLYGEAFEVNQTAARDGQRGGGRRSCGPQRPLGLRTCLAGEWLAGRHRTRSVSSAEIEEDLEQVPESLYRFFADEVFTSLGGDVQQGLTTLSVAPALDQGTCRRSARRRPSNAVVASALDVGFLVERDARLDLHPLARAFLKERVGAWSRTSSKVPSRHASLTIGFVANGTPLSRPRQEMRLLTTWKPSCMMRSLNLSTPDVSRLLRRGTTSRPTEACPPNLSAVAR